MLTVEYEGHLIDLTAVKPNEFTTAEEAKQCIVIYFGYKLACLTSPFPY